MPLIPARRRLRQEDACKFEATLVYKRGFPDRLQNYIQRNPVMKKKNHLTSKWVLAVR